MLAVVLFLAGCGADEPEAPAGQAFTKIALPAGAVPVTLTAFGDGIVIGVRQDDRPSLLRLDADGTAVRTVSGDVWTRQPSAGTPLESTRESLKFPMAAIAVRCWAQSCGIAGRGDGVRVATHDGTKWTVEPVTGPTGTVTAATTIGNTIHLLAGDELWWGP